EELLVLVEAEVRVELNPRVVLLPHEGHHEVGPDAFGHVVDLTVEVVLGVLDEWRPAHAAIDVVHDAIVEPEVVLARNVVDVQLTILHGDDRRMREREELVGDDREDEAVWPKRLGQKELAVLERKAEIGRGISSVDLRVEDVQRGERLRDASNNADEKSDGG